MKFALSNGQRNEAEPGLAGECPGCSSPVIAKCGEVKVWHWAHLGRRMCDSWWENETEWHRDWKNHFPKEWQEIIQYSDSGEKHIADIQTDQKLVIEFQHSYLKSEERNSRSAFYKKLVWVVDGKRLKRDETNLVKAMQIGERIGPAIRIPPDECALLKNWISDRAPVFFDFGKAALNPERSVLWLLFPKTSDGMAYVVPYLRSDFIEMHLNGTSIKALEFEKLLIEWPAMIQNYFTQKAKTESSQQRPLLPISPVRRGRSRRL